MATSYFGNRSSGNALSPFSQLKSIPLTNRTNVPRNGTIFSSYSTYLSVYRSAVANNYFQFGSTFTTCSLNSVNAAGTPSTVGTSIFNSYLVGSEAVVVHLNTTDQCLYVLLYESPNYQLIKISDAAGTTTPIGSSFTVATTTNWPTNMANNPATMYIDGAGHLRIYCRGYYHQINKTTGAIVSQDNDVNIGSYSLVNTAYLSSSGAIASSLLYPSGYTTEAAFTIPSIVTASSGCVTETHLKEDSVFGPKIVNTNISYLIMVDNDKLHLGLISGESGSLQSNFGYIYRADFDQFLQSVSDWVVGA